MTSVFRRRGPRPEAISEKARVLRELTENPGAPDLDQLTEFVRIVHLRLFGVAHDRAHPLGERTGAVTQLGREALAASGDDPKGTRDEVRELLTALRGHETSDPDVDSPELLEAIDRALQHC